MRSILFDFDGTLVNTAIDMVNSLRELAQRHHIYHEFDVDYYKQYVSTGAIGLIKSIFKEGCDETYASLRDQYIEIYKTHFKNSNHIFDGMEQVIAYLNEHNIKWGIVTNKPSWLALPIVQSISLIDDETLLLCADQIGVPKPDPKGLLMASEVLGVNPSECYYLGDAESDVIAAQKAGMQSLVAAWGYLPRDTDARQWQADRIINQPLELIDLFE